MIINRPVAYVPHTLWHTRVHTLPGAHVTTAKGEMTRRGHASEGTKAGKSRGGVAGGSAGGSAGKGKTRSSYAKPGGRGDGICTSCGKKGHVGGKHRESTYPPPGDKLVRIYCGRFIAISTQSEPEPEDQPEDQPEPED